MAKTYEQYAYEKDKQRILRDRAAFNRQHGYWRRVKRIQETEEEEKRFRNNHYQNGETNDNNGQEYGHDW